MKPGEKIRVVERDGSNTFGTITEVWPENEYHRAGFRANLHYKSHVKNVEFKQNEIGEFVFYAK